MWTTRVVVTLALLLLFQRANGDFNALYPYGEPVGDIVISDETYILLEQDVKVCKEIYYQCKVKDGLLIFEDNNLGPDPQQLPLPDNPAAFVAMFWADHDPTSGTVWYRQEHEQAFFDAVADELRPFDNCSRRGLTIKYAIVTTWEDVDYEGVHGPPCTDTYTDDICLCLEETDDVIENCTCLEGHDESYCNCVQGLDPMYCECMSLNNQNATYCDCMWWNNNDVYCNCWLDGFSAQYCHCLAAEFDEELCNCTVSNQRYDYYCDCLSESHTTPEYCNCMTQDMNDDFCHCMEMTNGDTDLCNCYESGSYEYCQCTEEGNGDDYCKCYDVFMNQVFCQCHSDGNSLIYCACMVLYNDATICGDNSNNDTTTNNTTCMLLYDNEDFCQCLDIHDYDVRQCNCSDYFDYDFCHCLDEYNYLYDEDELEYCKCWWMDGRESCFCKYYQWNSDEFCDCLDDHEYGTCSCLLDDYQYYESEWCDCMIINDDNDYCHCLNISSDYCACILSGNSSDYCSNCMSDDYYGYYYYNEQMCDCLAYNDWNYCDCMSSWDNDNICECLEDNYYDYWHYYDYGYETCVCENDPYPEFTEFCDCIGKIDEIYLSYQCARCFVPAYYHDYGYDEYYDNAYCSCLISFELIDYIAHDVCWCMSRYDLPMDECECLVNTGYDYSQCLCVNSTEITEVCDCFDNIAEYTYLEDICLNCNSPNYYDYYGDTYCNCIGSYDVIDYSVTNICWCAEHYGFSPETCECLYNNGNDYYQCLCDSVDYGDFCYCVDNSNDYNMCLNCEIYDEYYYYTNGYCTCNGDWATCQCSMYWYDEETCQCLTDNYYNYEYCLCDATVYGQDYCDCMTSYDWYDCYYQYNTSRQTGVNSQIKSPKRQQMKLAPHSTLFDEKLSGDSRRKEKLLSHEGKHLHEKRLLQNRDEQGSRHLEANKKMLHPLTAEHQSPHTHDKHRLRNSGSNKQHGQDRKMADRRQHRIEPFTGHRERNGNGHRDGNKEKQQHEKERNYSEKKHSNMGMEKEQIHSLRAANGQKPVQDSSIHSELYAVMEQMKTEAKQKKAQRQGDVILSEKDFEKIKSQHDWKMKSYYRQTERQNRSPSDTFVDRTRKAENARIVPACTNTYQMVLAGNSKKTFLILNYGNICWTTGDTSGGVDGLDGNIANVGVSAPSTQGFQHPLGQTPQVLDLDTGSNTGVPGRYAYQINAWDIRNPDCSSLD